MNRTVAALCIVAQFTGCTAAYRENYARERARINNCEGFNGAVACGLNRAGAAVDRSAIDLKQANAECHDCVGRALGSIAAGAEATKETNLLLLQSTPTTTWPSTIDVRVVDPERYNPGAVDVQIQDPQRYNGDAVDVHIQNPNRY